MDRASKACLQDFAESRPWFMTAAALAVLLSLSVAVSAQTTADSTFIQLEAKISLGPVRGRIDHMAFDIARRRLFVAELGNDSVGVVDVDARKTIQTIGGLAEPQGVGYVASTDTLYVANARDGSVRMFRGADYAAAGRIDLGSDADNVRFDAATNRIFVGYGGGAIGAIDVTQQKKFGEIPLPVHPEGFQIGGEPRKVFVNLPGAHAIAVLDGVTGTQMATWPLRVSGNFAMALDPSNGRVLIVSRSPPKLSVHAAEDGSLVTTVETCGDSDDLFIDDKRGRVYVSCGAGFIDVFDARGNAYNRVAHVPTAAGARTALFVPETDRLYLATRANGATEAAIWIFRPVP
jgi:YVTN family beta-propeller protein